MTKPERWKYKKSMDGLSEYRNDLTKWRMAHVDGLRDKHRANSRRHRRNPDSATSKATNFDPEYWNVFISRLFTKARASAKKRGIRFEVTKRDVMDLYRNSGGKCMITGLPFRGVREGMRAPLAPSIDRIDSSKGYVRGNIRLILWAINLGMGDMSDETYYRVCKAVVDCGFIGEESSETPDTSDQS